jgi:tRNA(Ile)-lysidine synthase TilS/MesJ
VGEPVRAVLAREYVPPSSVVVLRDATPVADNHRLAAGESYEAQLIEGYEVGAIRAALAAIAGGPDDAPYLKRRLSLSATGAVESEAVPMELEDVARHVEETVEDTCAEFDLLPPSSSVLVGLSGGVDSTCLLLALDSLRRQRGRDFKIVAATFEDADAAESPSFDRASSIARELDVEHVIVPASRAQDVFGLTARLDEVLPRLMHTAHAHVAMYADHHVTRRLLEVEADARGISRIALGLHTTDIVAGLLNGFMTGYASGNLPSRPVGDYVYVYPLAFVSKRELHLYHLHRRGHLAAHTEPNPWERNPTDRSFYYWLADALQELWPGHEHLLITGQATRARGLSQLAFTRCPNCGGAQLQQSFTVVRDGECDICRALRAEGFIPTEVQT